MSLHEKIRRIKSKNAFKYIKPHEPPSLIKAVNFKYQKGIEVFSQQGFPIREKGEALFQTVSRERRALTTNFGPPEKLTNDCGLGHTTELTHLDNKRKVDTRDRSVCSFVSTLGREEQFYKLVEQRKNYESSEFIERYFEYFNNLEIKEDKRNEALKKLETHILMSRKSKAYWEEYQNTVNNI
jgi:hypothetical protein